jgi:hypothetical protein
MKEELRKSEHLGKRKAYNYSTTTNKRRLVKTENSDSNCSFANLDIDPSTELKDGLVFLEQRLLLEMSGMKAALNENERQINELKQENALLGRLIERRSTMEPTMAKVLFNSDVFERDFEHLDRPVTVLTFPDGRFIAKNAAFRELLCSVGQRDVVFCFDIMEMNNRSEQRRIYDECVRRHVSNQSYHQDIPLMTFISIGKLKNKVLNETQTQPYHCTIVCSADLKPLYSVSCMCDKDQIPPGESVGNMFYVT